jgi:hypothetical protein
MSTINLATTSYAEQMKGWPKDGLLPWATGGP